MNRFFNLFDEQVFQNIPVFLFLSFSWIIFYWIILFLQFTLPKILLRAPLTILVRALDLLRFVPTSLLNKSRTARLFGKVLSRIDSDVFALNEGKSVIAHVLFGRSGINREINQILLDDYCRIESAEAECNLFADDPSRRTLGIYYLGMSPHVSSKRSVQLLTNALKTNPENIYKIVLRVLYNRVTKMPQLENIDRIISKWPNGMREEAQSLASEIRSNFAKGHIDAREQKSSN